MGVKKQKKQKKDTASSTKGHGVEGRFSPEGIIIIILLYYYIIILLYYYIIPIGKIDK